MNRAKTESIEHVIDIQERIWVDFENAEAIEIVSSANFKASINHSGKSIYTIIPDVGQRSIKYDIPIESKFTIEITNLSDHSAISFYINRFYLVNEDIEISKMVKTKTT